MSKDYRGNPIIFNPGQINARDFHELLETFQPSCRPLLGKYTTDFAAAVSSSSSSSETKEQLIKTHPPTIQELRDSVSASLQGKGLPYPQGITPQSYSEETVGRMEAHILRAKNPQTIPTVVMFYGGGFCLNTIEAHKAFMANIAAKYSCNVVIPDYPLAPENKAPKIIAKSTEFLREFLKKPLFLNLSENVILMGWSSGSSQALTTALNLQEKSMSLFRKISQLILLSPWIDLTLCVNREGPYQDQQNLDTLAAGADVLERMSKWYLPEGARGNEPEFCPAFRSPNEISKLPLVTIISGGSEVLLGDGIFLAHELRLREAPVQLIVVEGQTHNYMVFHELNLDGVFVPEIIANIISGKPVDDEVGKDGLGLDVRRFNTR